MGDPPGMEGGVPATDSSQRVCDYATYMELLQENAELHRSNRLLQAVAVVPNSSPSGDDERSRQWELLQTELKVSEAKLKDLEAILNGQDVDLTLVEEKRHLQHLNVGLSEKVAAIQAKEARTRGELQDSRDQAELLEFRVLELEDERDRVSKTYETPFFCRVFYNPFLYSFKETRTCSVLPVPTWTLAATRLALRRRTYWNAISTLGYEISLTQTKPTKTSNLSRPYRKKR